MNAPRKIFLTAFVSSLLTALAFTIAAHGKAPPPINDDLSDAEQHELQFMNDDLASMRQAIDVINRRLGACWSTQSAEADRRIRQAHNMSAADTWDLTTKKITRHPKGVANAPDHTKPTPYRAPNVPPTPNVAPPSGTPAGPPSKPSAPEKKKS